MINLLDVIVRFLLTLGAVGWDVTAASTSAWVNSMLRALSGKVGFPLAWVFIGASLIIRADGEIKGDSVEAWAAWGKTSCSTLPSTPFNKKIVVIIYD